MTISPEEWDTFLSSTALKQTARYGLDPQTNFTMVGLSPSPPLPHRSFPDRASRQLRMFPTKAQSQRPMRQTTTRATPETRDG